MDIRKVQITGGSSFVITLPKEWASAINLKRGDPLGIVIQPDGSLLISPPDKLESESTVKRFQVDEIKDHELLFRLLVGAYISGYNTIEVNSENRLTTDVREAVTRITQTAIGLEILEEYDKQIVLKDLVDPSEMRFRKTIERMRVLVKNMLADCFIALTKRDVSIINDIEIRDNDVDRLEWLISRQMNMAQKDVRVARKLGATPQEIMSNYIIGRILERIGDHAVMISHNVRTLIEDNVDESISDQIVRAGKYAIALFSESVDVLFSQDVQAANANINNIKELVEICREINRIALNQEAETALSISLIAGSIRRTGEYSTDLSELTINILMD